MEFVHLKYCSDGRYPLYDASNIGMTILGRFLISDVGCYWPTFREWAVDDKSDPKSRFTYSFGGNITDLEEEGDDIYLFDGTESMTEEIRANGCKIPRLQFIQLLDDWKEKVCVPKPKEVMIKYENGQFVIETKG